MITDKAGRAHFVIDQHVHVGMRPARSTTASSSYLPDELITNMDANGVDMVVGFRKPIRTRTTESRTSASSPR